MTEISKVASVVKEKYNNPVFNTNEYNQLKFALIPT